MLYEGATDLLTLVNDIIPNKSLFLSHITDETFTVMKTLDNETQVAIKEGQSFPTSKSI